MNNQLKPYISCYTRVRVSTYVYVYMFRFPRTITTFVQGKEYRVHLARLSETLPH